MITGARASGQIGWFACLGGVLLLAFTGCRTRPAWPPVNTAEPGWEVQQGQAVWRSTTDAPGLAGELTVAMHPGGESLVQFSKPPLPLIVARSRPGDWRIEIPAKNRHFAGRGLPGSRFGWLALPGCLRGETPPEGWQFERLPGHSWRLENQRTGERLEGWLAP